MSDIVTLTLAPAAIISIIYIGFKFKDVIRLLESINAKLGPDISSEKESYLKQEKKDVYISPSENPVKDSWYCEKCGNENSPKDKVCKSCGGLKSKIMV